MSQCCVLRDDGTRCPNEVFGDDVVCADCCEQTEILIRKIWEEKLAKHDNN